MNKMDLTFDRYSKLLGCDKFDQDMLMLVEQLAQGLSHKEALAYFGVIESDLNPAERRYFQTAYDRGVAQAKHLATQKLFSAMSDKGGGAIAMEYLRMFSEKFPDEGEGAGTSGFQLKVIKDVLKK